MALVAPAPGTTFTRGELVQLVGLNDGVVTFWLRNGLLRSISGGEGKGNHRRFDRMQVTIAAVLGELHRFGLNIAALGAIAQTLQKSVEVGQRYQVRPFVLWLAAGLRERIAKFDAGGTILVHSIEDDQIVTIEAASHRDLAVDRSMGERSCTHEELLQIALSLEMEELSAATLYYDVAEVMDNPGHLSRVSWLLWQNGDEWQFDSAADEYGFNQSDARSGIYLGLSAILLKTWAIGVDEREAHRELERRRHEAELPEEVRRRLKRQRGVEAAGQ
jgi:DNA-binding transcriptional MerR regulator